MSFVLGLIIILVCLLVIGVNANIIIGIALGAVVLVNFLLLLFFVGCAAVLAGSQQKKALFSRIEKRTGEQPEGGSTNIAGKKAKFDRACYIIDGREFPNAFPCEIMMRDRLYSADKEVKVRLCPKQGVVFDRNAFAAVILGFAFFAAVCIGIAVMLLEARG